MPDDWSVYEDWLTEDYTVDDYTKSPITQAIEHIHVYQPDKKEAVFAFYESILEKIIQQHKAGVIIDEEFVASIVSSIVDFKFKKLVPQVAYLYENDLVDLLFAGDFEDFEESLTDNYNSHNFKLPKSIFDRYTEILTTWHGYTGEQATGQKVDWEKSGVLDKLSAPLQEPVADKPVLTKKVGRNDPCVCGSGKKFKKCCIKKYK